MAEARRDLTEQEKEQKAFADLRDRMMENRILRRFFIGLLMDNLVIEDGLKVAEMKFHKVVLFSNNCAHAYSTLLLDKSNLMGDKKTDYFTNSTAANMLFSYCLSKAFKVAYAKLDPTDHNLIQKIREWVSFLDPTPQNFPALESKSEAKSTMRMRREILDKLVELAKRPDQTLSSAALTTAAPFSYPTDSAGSRSPPNSRPANREESKAPDSPKEDSEEDKRFATHLARELLRNIWDIDTLRMLIADKSSQDIITQTELNREGPSLSENKNAIPFKERKEAAPNLFSQVALPREYIDIILFLNKKLKVFEKISEYKTKEKDRQITLQTLKKSILTAKSEGDILQAFLKAVGDIKQRAPFGVRKGKIGGSNLYDIMQKACVDILGKHIDLLEEHAQQETTRTAGPGPGNAAAAS